VVKNHKPDKRTYDCPCEDCERVRQLSDEDLQAEMGRVLSELSRRTNSALCVMQSFTTENKERMN